MKSKTFFGHPRQLSALFSIELWERFSFYGMQAILFIYMYYEVSKGGLGIDQSLAGGIVGAYSGSIYLATILGGWLADRVWGAEKTLFISGIIVMLGHIALAFLPGLSGLITGLVLVALGSGGVKSSASAMVGTLYEAKALRPLRDAGFSIFYIAINIGGFLGPLLTGLLQSEIGFHYGFGAAAVGMAFGLCHYSIVRRQFPKTEVPYPLSTSQVKQMLLLLIAVLCLIVMGLSLHWLNLDNFPQVLLAVVIVTSITYFIRLLTSKNVASDNKRYIKAYIPLFIVLCLFWATWYQIYTVATVYFDSVIDRVIGAFTIPVAWMSSLQSFWVILFSGVFATIWTKMADKQPKTPMKFTLSLAILGASYCVFIPFLMENVAMPLVVL